MTAVAAPAGSLVYTTIPNAFNANSQIVLFPIDDAGDYVISAGAACGTPAPFFLSARGYPLSSPLSLTAVISTGSNYVWSKSRGYLPGNSPNHNPPTTNILQQFILEPADSLFTNYPALTFPHGRGGAYGWQLTAELPSALYPNPESFSPRDLPAFGTYLLYDAS